MGEARLDRSEYFMRIAEATALRSTCPRSQVGAVLVDKNNRIISTGYNGAPRNNPHCLDVGCTMYDDHCVATVHAEANALLMGNGEGVTLYTTHYPCYRCRQLIQNSTVKQLYYRQFYADKFSNIPSFFIPRLRI